MAVKKVAKSSKSEDSMVNKIFVNLNDALSALNNDEAKIAESVLAVAVERFGGDHGFLLEVQDTTGGLKEVASFGAVEEMLNQDMRIFAQYASDHPQDEESVIIAPKAMEVKKLAARKSIRRDMSVEVLIFPLASEGEAVGVLYLGSKKKGKINFENVDKDILLQFGSAIGEIFRINRDIQRLNRQNSALQEKIKTDLSFDDLIGSSEGVQRIKRALELIVDMDIPVTLIGETGTGKRLISKIIHNKSSRADKPYVSFEAGEIPEKMIAGSLFGQTTGVRGAPARGRKGALREAKGGTLFINHVELLPLNVQSQLAQAIERGEMVSIGDDREYLVDVRLVMSTTGNIKKLYENGKIKEELYQKMVQFPIMITPLRDRSEDLSLLVPHFVETAAAAYGKTIAGISTEVYDYLGAYSWPGNLSELQKELRQSVLRTPDRSGNLLASSLSTHLVGLQQPTLEDPGEGTLKQRIALIEKKMIIDALERHNHNQSMTADTLGLSRQALINKLHRYGIETGRKYKRKMREIAAQAGSK